jgi:single-strand DNA-binding protein
MKGYSKTIMVGNLTRDPETKVLQSGKQVTNFAVAVSREFSKDNEVDFFNCEAWGKPAEFIADYSRKGDPILLEGRFQNDKFTNSDGDDVIRTKFKVDTFRFLGSKRDESEAQSKAK